MRTLLIAGALAGLSMPLYAQASAPLAPPAAARPMADRIMTRSEVDAKVRTHFARLDVNRDGALTTDELDAPRGKQSADRQARRGTGKPRDPNAAFDRLDSNRDGMIDRGEFARGREIRIEKRVVMKADGTSGGRPGAMHGKRGMHRGMMRAGMLRMADANRDGRVTLQEATSGALRHFDMVDTNRDGRITPDERRAGRGMMRQMRGRAA